MEGFFFCLYVLNVSKIEKMMLCLIFRLNILDNIISLTKLLKVDLKSLVSHKSIEFFFVFLDKR